MLKQCQAFLSAPDVHGGEAVLPVALLLLRMRLGQKHRKQQAGKSNNVRCGWHFGWFAGGGVGLVS